MEKNAVMRCCKLWVPQRSAELKDRCAFIGYLAKALRLYICECVVFDTTQLEADFDSGPILGPVQGSGRTTDL